MSAGEPASDWMPLTSSPVFNWLGGYEIGFRLQTSAEGNNFQTVALTFTGVPDGRPTQPLLMPPYCVGRGGTPGTIMPVDEIPIQFEGDGAYSIAVSLGPGPAQTGCFGAGGRTTNASFGVAVHVAPELVGDPFAFRAKPLPGNSFVGIRAVDPPGGYADSTCALDAAVAPDGSVTGRRVAPENFDPPRQTIRTFPEPGRWTCVSAPDWPGIAPPRPCAATVSWGS
jgi:hypothetical protein